MAKLFGTDGVRGVANVYPMTIDFASNLAVAAANLLCKQYQRVAIAKDTRVSSDMLEAALTAGFTAQGVDVLKLGVIPTPAVTALTPRLNVDLAVMITASHNPYQDNGIKLIAANGDKLTDEQTALLEQNINNPKQFEAGKIGKISTYENAISEYLEPIRQQNAGKPLQGLKIVVDCANGCFAGIMPQVFQELGAEVIALAVEPDGTNINRDCGSQHPEQMMQKVVAEKADIGIAADGDGDRIIVCDDKGNKLDGDQIIAFLSMYYQQVGKLQSNKVAATITSNPALDTFLQTLGLKCERSAVGERHVIELMKKSGANIGGEESGHIVIADFAKTGDCLVSGIILALGLKYYKRKMSEIFPLFEPMPRYRLDSKFGTVGEMQEAFNNAEFQAVVKDGQAKLGDNGRILVRKSGTEPKIQVWVWSYDEKYADLPRQISQSLSEAKGFQEQKLQ